MIARVRKKRTLRYKFIIAFIIVTLPLILFLFYNNYYAMNVVREQVSQSNINLISTQAAKKYIALAQTVSYLLRQATSKGRIFWVSTHAVQRCTRRSQLYIEHYGSDHIGVGT